MARREVGDALLDVQDLDVDYLTLGGAVRAVSDVSFTLRRGEILGLAGESGSGKSTLAMALLRLQRAPAVTTGGKVLFHDDSGQVIDLVPRTDKELQRLRWNRLAIVMQSAMDALNPVKRLGAQFVDVLREHDPRLTEKQALQRAGDLLALSGIPRDRVDSFPHEMSGGMRQRSLISLALACDPELVVMDEPTTAVDVVMQRTIMSQVLRLQRELGFAIIFVTHDLSLLLELSDRPAIMYAGRIVEIGASAELYRRPRHPYTRALRDSFPPLYAPLTEMRGIPGSAPDLRNLPAGCAFVPRCEHAMDLCREARPGLVGVGAGVEAACHLNDSSSPEGDPPLDGAVGVGTTAGYSAPGAQEGDAA